MIVIKQGVVSRLIVRQRGHLSDLAGGAGAPSLVFCRGLRHGVYERKT